MLHQNLCLTCGAVLKKVDDTQYACESCGNVYSAEKVENYVDKMRELLDDAKLEMISTARKNLYSAITEAHLSSEKICKWSDEIKKYLPDDFQANFYGSFDDSKDLQEIASMIRNIDVEENFECLELLLNFLIKSIESELVTDTLYLIERAYKIYSNNLEKYNKYSTWVSIEAEKLDECIYETNYPRDVFVAYSSKDSNKALELVSELEAQGLSCFIALRNLRHGSGSKENYEKALREAMDNCTSFVFVSSMNSRNQACDALKVEIPYIKKRDEHRAASVPFTTYANIPIEYKKPRVEYRLEESTRRLAADRIVDEFFTGYERVYTPFDVAERVMRQSSEVVSDSTSQVPSQMDIAKLVEEQIKAQREAEKRREEEEKRRIEEEKRREEERKKAEAIRLKQEEEKRKKEEKERLRREEEERKRKAEEEKRKRKEEEERKRKEEEEQERKAEEERKRKEAEEKKKCDLLYQEYLAALKNEKDADDGEKNININSLKDQLTNLESLKNSWDSIEQKIFQLTKNTKEFNDKISQLNSEKENLAFFAGKRKKEIATLIEDYQRQQYLINEKIASAEKEKQGYKSINAVIDAIKAIEMKIFDEQKMFAELNSNILSERSSKTLYAELSKYEYGKLLLSEKGDHVKFGSYPQTKVTDSSLINILNSKAGALPTRINSYAWISYNYYIDGKVSDFMWYIDVQYEGEKYRGVYFTSYRPKEVTLNSVASNTLQLNNGYLINTVYWFKYEPILWRILSKDNQKAFVCCDRIIDSQQFDIAKNNYENSTIRKWLNQIFFNTAFTELQQQSIITITLDNSVASTGYSSNQYACADTQDKVFLLSYKEVTNGIYKFLVDGTRVDIARKKKTTDYAQSQGVDTNSDNGYGWWWLRSPDRKYSYFAREVDFNGYAYDTNYVSITPRGVVPALQIKLSELN